MKYILVTGGVVSGIGKGSFSSSIGALLRESGLTVCSIKIDPYLNIDSGLLSPFEHGETYVLEDGGETDLDLGNYERFLNCTLTSDHQITTGKIYKLVLEKERRGEYLGKTVQVVPHITGAIQEWIERVAQIPVDGTNRSPDVCLIELGGTVGDIESLPYLEALRQLFFTVGRENYLHSHISLVPVLNATNEQKSKPTVHAVKPLMAAGLPPDVIALRCISEVELSIKRKVGMFCNLKVENVLSLKDLNCVYQLPGVLLKQNILDIVFNKMNINKDIPKSVFLWDNLYNIMHNATITTKVAIVGKYTKNPDCYASLKKSLQHACIKQNTRLKIEWIEATELEEKDRIDDTWNRLKTCQAVVVGGGFDSRGTEGMILAIKHCRENKIPFLGICLGFQLLVVEYCRHILNIADANSEELVKDISNDKKVILYMPDVNESKNNMGGTMRLGGTDINIVKKDSIASKIYNNENIIHERHRHRYEVNPDFIDKIEKSGLFFSARCDNRMEICELADSVHPYFLGCQFHPEYLSRPHNPVPLFIGLIKATQA